MSDSTQLTLFKETPWEQFQKWKELPGAGHVLRDLYAIAAPYATEWQRTKVTVSMKLLFELERHKIKHVRARAQKQGIKLPDWQGYTLNNSFTAPIADHIETHRPDWQGMFEHRQSPRRNKKQWALIVERSAGTEPALKDKETA